MFSEDIEDGGEDLSLVPQPEGRSVPALELTQALREQLLAAGISDAVRMLVWSTFSTNSYP